MQYSPKLKKAMEEIAAVIKKHDIAGVVVLHTPNYSEHKMFLQPSYSCVSEFSDNHIRVKAKAAGDFAQSPAVLNALLEGFEFAPRLDSNCDGDGWFGLQQPQDGHREYPDH